MDYTIRQAHLSDLPYIYDICLKTGFNGKDASVVISDPLMIGQYYAAPYLHYEIDNCFIVDKDYIPFGYILGVSSTENYYKWLNTYWLPMIRNRYPETLSPKSDFKRFFIDIINQDAVFEEFLFDYPSHLHIDLLPQIQRKGIGQQLMITFIKKLKEKGSTGLHFGVGVENTNAIEFYKKMGFLEIKSIPGTIFMGKMI